ncbi:MAG: hypothetical protein JO299_19485 [Gammaproteobacteria bacterium]|nr:hypothetical protein [Gammaproteobacteria bacterium]
MPDVPITSLAVSFDGGPNSLLKRSGNLCAAGQSVQADLSAYSGATAHLAVPVSGCGGSGGGGGSAVSGAKAPRASIKLGRGKHPRLKLEASAGQGAPALKTVALKLPAGVQIDKGKLPHGVSVVADGKRVSGGASGGRHSLTVSLGGGARTIVIALRSPSLVLGSRILKHKLHRLKALVTLTDTSGKQTQLTLTQLL